MDKFLMIDGNSLLHRSYHGVQPLSNGDGVVTHAIFGFLNTYFSICNKYSPTHIAVAFDTHSPTFRHKLSSEYKANRPKMPDDLVTQFKYLKQILQYLGIQYVECPRYEADDILGTLSRACVEDHMQCSIVSGDKDILQLIDPTTNVILLSFQTKTTYTEQTFFRKYGFKPINLIDYKAIAGDPSDNYRGINGLGEKTVTQLVKQFGTIENIYSHLDEVQLSPTFFKRLVNGQQDATLCKQLATINRHAPIDTNLETYRYHGIADREQLRETLLYLDMKKFISKLKLDEPSETVTNDAFKLNTTILDRPFTTTSLHTDYIIDDGTLYIYDNEKVYQTSDPAIIVDYLHSDTSKRTIGVKAHYAYTNYIKNVVMDAEICGYLLDTSAKEYTVQSLCEDYHVHYIESLDNADIYSLPLLNDVLSANIENANMQDLLHLELLIAEVLVDMEHVGIHIDVPTVEEYQGKLSQILDGLASQIYQYAGKEFKILSPQQLSQVLFEDLQLPKKKKTKTGYSTDNTVLEQLKDRHPIVPLIIEYRFYSKLSSTYLDGLLKCVQSDGRVHTVFRQTETRTGRLSSAEPNLQNIPIRNDFAKNIRKFFTAEEGKVLIDADYNQIELRLTAILSKDTNMVNAFLAGKDIHTMTAMKVFYCDESQVTPQMRNVAKSINFGLIYGMGASKLAKEINTTNKEAKKYIDSYFASYPNIKTFMEKTIEGCRTNGYVKTLMNRVRNVPEVNVDNSMLRAIGERIAMNTPIQGSSADIIKLAMVNVYDRLRRENLNAKLVLQVHDELLIESDEDCAETVAKIVKEEMENVVYLEVPLTVEVHIGGSWFDAH